MFWPSMYPSSRSPRWKASTSREGPGRETEQKANAGNLPRLLRLDGEWRERQAESENDREPDPPHWTHLGEDCWRESSRIIKCPHF